MKKKLILLSILTMGIALFTQVNAHQMVCVRVNLANAGLDQTLRSSCKYHFSVDTKDTPTLRCYIVLDSPTYINVGTASAGTAAFSSPLGLMTITAPRTATTTTSTASVTKKYVPVSTGGMMQQVQSAALSAANAKSLLAAVAPNTATAAQVAGYLGLSAPAIKATAQDVINALTTNLCTTAPAPR